MKKKKTEKKNIVLESLVQTKANKQCAI